jgi:hypothetical protein
MLDEKIEKKRRPFRVVLPLAACLVMSAGGAGAAESPRVTGNVPVNAPQQLFPNDNPTRSTSSITSDVDGRLLLVAFEDLQGLCGPPANLACPPENPPGLSAYAFSTNGGSTWTDGGFPFALGNAITAGHPWVDRLGRGRGEDGDGDRAGKERRREKDTYFYASRMQDATTGLQTAGIGIYRGHFGAGTFVFDDGQIINSAHASVDEYSRPAVAAAKDGGTSAYVVLVNVDEICNVPFAGFGQIELWRTHDGGDTWQGPAIVGAESSLITDPQVPGCGRQGYLQIAPAVAIGPRESEVYTVWEHGPQFFSNGTNTPTDTIRFSASFDGGQTFTVPVDIAPVNAMRANPPVGYAKNRMNDQARIAVATSGAHKGRIYVSFYSAVSPVLGVTTVQSLVSSQGFVMHSDDRGQTWSAPLPVGPPVPPTGQKRFWPTVSVRPDGDVDVVYLESQEVVTGTPCTVAIGPNHAVRTGPASSLVDTFWVQSHDGGETFSSPLKVSSETSNWCKSPYMFDDSLLADGFLVSNGGDYLGSTSLDDRTLVVWPDDRNVFMDTFFAEIRGRASRASHGEGEEK